MAILLQLLKLVFPLLREYGISNLRMKRNGKKITFLATATTIFILTLFIGYLSEQATTNLRLHEPIARQYQTLEKNDQRLIQQLEVVRQSRRACEGMLQECRDKFPTSVPLASTYDPEKKIMVIPESLQKDTN